MAEYALRGFSKPIGVADCETGLTETLPDDLKGSLPSIEEIKAGWPERRQRMKNSEAGNLKGEKGLGRAVSNFTLHSLNFSMELGIWAIGSHFSQISWI